MGLLDAFADPQFRKDVVRGLLDAGNRGAVAGLLGGPVDLATMAMRPFGYNVEQPVGGSEWIGQKMQNAGFVSPERNRLAEALASVAVPAAANRLAPTLFAAEQKAAQNLAAPNRMNAATRGQTGAIVYHGSPHKFDKFDSSKIGTGEGAQAYGHGLYLAESPDVAKSYQAMSYNRTVALPDGKGYALFDSATDKKISETFANKDAALKAKEAFSGNHYKVDLPDEHIAKMLDWDKPLSQQPQAFKDAVSAREQQRMMPILEQRRATLAGLPQGAENASILKKQIAILEDEITQPQAVPNMTGGEYFNYLRNREMAPAEQADWLRKAGIPGIRYLDGGSRGAGTGTSNFVVFPGNENILRILERNGVPLP